MLINTKYKEFNFARSYKKNAVICSCQQMQDSFDMHFLNENYEELFRR